MSTKHAHCWSWVYLGTIGIFFGGTRVNDGGPYDERVQSKRPAAHPWGRENGRVRGGIRGPRHPQGQNDTVFQQIRRIVAWQPDMVQDPSPDFEEFTEAWQSQGKRKTLDKFMVSRYMIMRHQTIGSMVVLARAWVVEGNQHDLAAMGHARARIRMGTSNSRQHAIGQNVGSARLCTPAGHQGPHPGLEGGLEQRRQDIRRSTPQGRTWRRTRTTRKPRLWRNNMPPTPSRTTLKYQAGSCPPNLL